MRTRKTDKADIRSRYPIYVELGLIAALALLVAAFHVPFRATPAFDDVVLDRAIVHLKDIQPTRHELPPPPRPPVPVAVPNHRKLADVKLNFDVTLDPNESLAPIPPPPAPERGEEEDREPFWVVEQMPRPVGGIQAVYEAVEYPDFARRAGIEGTVYVQFTIDKQGNVINPVIVSGVHELLNQAALRAIQQVEFTPGMQRGRPVMVRMSVPIRFELQ